MVVALEGLVGQLSSVVQNLSDSERQNDIQKFLSLLNLVDPSIRALVLASEKNVDDQTYRFTLPSPENSHWVVSTNSSFDNLCGAAEFYLGTTHMRKQATSLQNSFAHSIEVLAPPAILEDSLDPIFVSALTDSAQFIADMGFGARLEGKDKKIHFRPAITILGSGVDGILHHRLRTLFMSEFSLAQLNEKEQLGIDLRYGITQGKHSIYVDSDNYSMSFFSLNSAVDQDKMMYFSHVPDIPDVALVGGNNLISKVSSALEFPSWVSPFAKYAYRLYWPLTPLVGVRGDDSVRVAANAALCKTYLLGLSFAKQIHVHGYARNVTIIPLDAHKLEQEELLGDFPDVDLKRRLEQLYGCISDCALTKNLVHKTSDLTPVFGMVAQEFFGDDVHGGYRLIEAANRLIVNKYSSSLN